MTEHQLQNSIIEWLEYKKFYVMRLNSGAIPSLYKGKQRMIRLSKKGTPDLMCFKESEYCTVKLVFIEVKIPGKEPTIDQVEMMRELESYGAICFVIHSIEELTEAFNNL